MLNTDSGSDILIRPCIYVFSEVVSVTVRVCLQTGVVKVIVINRDSNQMWPAVVSSSSFFLSFFNRSAGEVPCGETAEGGEKLPHLLSAPVWSLWRHAQWVQKHWEKKKPDFIFSVTVSLMFYTEKVPQFDTTKLLCVWKLWSPLMLTLNLTSGFFNIVQYMCVYIYVCGIDNFSDR